MGQGIQCVKGNRLGNAYHLGPFSLEIHYPPREREFTLIAKLIATLVVTLIISSPMDCGLPHITSVWCVAQRWQLSRDSSQGSPLAPKCCPCSQSPSTSPHTRTTFRQQAKPYCCRKPSQFGHPRLTFRGSRASSRKVKYVFCDLYTRPCFSGRVINSMLRTYVAEYLEYIGCILDNIFRFRRSTVYVA